MSLIQLAPRQAAETAKPCPIKPARYFVMLQMRKPEEKTKGGIYIPGQTQDEYHIGEVVGQVVAMGPDAYKDNAKFPSGPVCQPGDWVVTVRYAGNRFHLDKTEYRLVPDTEIIGTVEDPDAVDPFTLKTR